MTDEQAAPDTCHCLTELQHDRIRFARQDYEHARAEDLARLPRAHLILLVERMRGRLGDVLDLADEVSSSWTNPTNHHP